MSEKTHEAGAPFPPLKPGKIRLYSMRFCPYAHRARLVLAHKNIQYETINVHLKNKPDWFLQRNPQGAVPTVELDDKVIYESTAVCEWLDDVYTQNRLQPSDPYIRAWDRILLEAFGKITTAFYAVMMKSEDRTKPLEEFNKGLKFYDDILAKRGGPLFGGKSPSLIDFYLWPVFERIPALTTWDAKLTVDKSKFPNLAAWTEAIQQVPAVKATMKDKADYLRFFNSFASGNVDYDFGL